MQGKRNSVHGTTTSQWAPWDLTQFSQSPSAAPSYFPESHWWSEISSLSKVILVWGKARNHRLQIYRGPESPGWFEILPKKLCMGRDAWAGVLWSNCQSPVAHGCGLLDHPNSLCRGVFKLSAKFDADPLLCSLSHFERTATQYTCSPSGTYRPHWLVHWSHHWSYVHIPVHSPWLPSHVKVTQTVLIILTLAGFFLDRPHTINLLKTKLWKKQIVMEIHSWYIVIKSV